jgi:hypothetical protein
MIYHVEITEPARQDLARLDLVTRALIGANIKAGLGQPAAELSIQVIEEPWCATWLADYLVLFRFLEPAEMDALGRTGVPGRFVERVISEPELEELAQALGLLDEFEPVSLVALTKELAQEALRRLRERFGSPS